MLLGKLRLSVVVLFKLAQLANSFVYAGSFCQCLFQVASRCRAKALIELRRDAVEISSPLLNTTSLGNPLPVVAVTTRVAPALLWWPSRSLLGCP